MGAFARRGADFAQHHSGITGVAGVPAGGGPPTLSEAFREAMGVRAPSPQAGSRRGHQLQAVT